MGQDLILRLPYNAHMAHFAAHCRTKWIKGGYNLSSIRVCVRVRVCATERERETPPSRNVPLITHNKVFLFFSAF